MAPISQCDRACRERCYEFDVEVATLTNPEIKQPRKPAAAPRQRCFEGADQTNAVIPRVRGAVQDAIALMEETVIYSEMHEHQPRDPDKDERIGIDSESFAAVRLKEEQ